MPTVNKFAVSKDILSLPERCVTFNGYEFFPNEDMWRIPDCSRIYFFNFKTLRSLCANEIVQAMKKTCIWYLENRSPSHANNTFNQFKYMVEELVSEGELLSHLSSHHIISYKGNLSTENECYLSVVAGFVKKWHDLGHPGVDDDVIKLLDVMTMKGNRKGWAVLTMDPVEGPFTELELHAIHSKINSAFASGTLGNRDFSLIWLFMATGARPAQIADIKVGDFQILTADGITKYWISIPRAKQRHARRRSSFKKRPLVPEIGVVLEAWISQVIKIGTKLSPLTDAKDLPLFPNWDLKGNHDCFLYHVDGAALSKDAKSSIDKFEIYSHRTREPMRITPQRFRYTLGTRAAMEKQGLLVIAELLDHSDTQNVIVYTKATPEIVKILDEAIAKELGQIAKAFAGEIVLDDFDTGRPDDQANLVRVPRLDPKNGGVGRCGTCVGCEAKVPYGCYVCSSFEAWVEGPHEEVLTDLLDERKKKLEETGDETIAFANDHVILAVAQVCDMCNEILAARGDK